MRTGGFVTGLAVILGAAALMVFRRRKNYTRLQGPSSCRCLLALMRPARRVCVLITPPPFPSLSLYSPILPRFWLLNT